MDVRCGCLTVGQSDMHFFLWNGNLILFMVLLMDKLGKLTKQFMKKRREILKYT